MQTYKIKKQFRGLKSHWLQLSLLRQPGYDVSAYQDFQIGAQNVEALQVAVMAHFAYSHFAY